MKYYTGIGSRKTPVNIQKQMTEIAIELMKKGYTLRSGGAGGADTAFEQGAGLDIQIFIPWNGFNGIQANETHIVPQFNFDMASQFHPAWDRCSFGAKKLHARNCNQILGRQIGTSKKSEFVICWTPNGMVTGGTGQAIRIAQKYNIPVYNLANLTPSDILNRI